MTDIVQAIRDPRLLGATFDDLASRGAWLVALKSMFGCPLNRHERRAFRKCTGRANPQSRPCREAWFVVGRRGGKTSMVAVLAAWFAIFKDWSPYLSVGERAVILIVAADRKQARLVLDYLRGMLQSTPYLSQLIESEGKERISLTNRVDIEVVTCSFRSTRGYAVPLAICDEVAFWRFEDEAANVDRAVIDAIRPAQAQFPQAMLVGVSSPYAQQGVMYEQHRDYFGKDGDDVLVWQAGTAMMNPTIDEKFLERERERDPVNFSAEYMAEFRRDISGYLDRELVEDAMRSESVDLPPIAGARYFAFTDPSGGRKDAFTLAVGHIEGDKRIIDAVRTKRPPFDPRKVVEEFTALMRGRYGLNRVMGDRYAGEWVSQAFRDVGMTYEPSGKNKSVLYLEAEPLFQGGLVELPNSKTLLNELTRLERRTRSGGRDIVDHPPRGADDLANAVAGCLVGCPRPGSDKAVFHISGCSDDLHPGIDVFEIGGGHGLSGY